MSCLDNVCNQANEIADEKLEIFNKAMIDLQKANQKQKRNNLLLKDELCTLLNKHSTEYGSNTPDFILANYLLACLDTFDVAVMSRDSWYECQNKINNHIDLKR